MPISPQVALITRKINLTALDQQFQAEAGELRAIVANPDELAFVNNVFLAAANPPAPRRSSRPWEN